MSYHEMMADREEARELGRLNPDRQWVLTDRDAWHRNPFYSGPEQPHPEDDYDDYDTEQSASGIAAGSLENHERHTMNEEQFADALMRLVDSAMGEISFDAIIDALEGRIGVVRSRAEDAELMGEIE